MKNTNAQAFGALANIRRTLMFARYYRQVDQHLIEASQSIQAAATYFDMQFAPYDGRFGFIAKGLRISARAEMQLVEKRAGYNFIMGISPLRGVRLYDKPFREWPEYAEVFTKEDDTWSNTLK